MFPLLDLIIEPVGSDGEVEELASSAEVNGTNTLALIVGLIMVIVAVWIIIATAKKRRKNK